MKIRNIPFGYLLENGNITLHAQESPVVKQIFASYLQGASLKAIADVIEIPYSEASPGWSKCKVKRVLDNVRYTGYCGYPAIIETDDFKTAQRLKSDKNTCIPAPLGDDVQILKPVVRCQICGRRLIRHIHPYGERWRCVPECENTSSLLDADLTNAVAAILDFIAQNVDVLQSDSCESRSSTLAVTKLQNEINREMGKVKQDADHLRILLLQCAAAKYAAIDDSAGITTTLRDAFAAYSPTELFDRALFAKTVDKVFITANGRVLLQLKNGQTLPKPS